MTPARGCAAAPRQGKPYDDEFVFVIVILQKAIPPA
jgi:hypothetical protein